MPLQEFASSHHNFLYQKDTPISNFKPPLDLFNLLIFQMLLFNTPTSHREKLDFTLQSLRDFRKQHVKDTRYYYNSHVYGNPFKGHEDKKLIERYWHMAHYI